MARLSERYRQAREDAGDCWASFCGFYLIHLFDRRPRRYNDHHRRHRRRHVEEGQEEGGWAPDQDGEASVKSSEEQQPEPQPSLCVLLQDLRAQNQNDQLVRSNMKRRANERADTRKAAIKGQEHVNDISQDAPVEVKTTGESFSGTGADNMADYRRDCSRGNAEVLQAPAHCLTAPPPPPPPPPATSRMFDIFNPETIARTEGTMAPAHVNIKRRVSLPLYSGGNRVKIVRTGTGTCLRRRG